jgi:hypothetical protein
MMRLLFKRYYDAGEFWERIATHAVNDVLFAQLSEKRRQLAERVYGEIRDWGELAPYPSRVFSPVMLMLEDKRGEGR